MSLPGPEPSRFSQAGKILRLLRDHPNEWIRRSDVEAEVGACPVADRVKELRKRGHVIECRQAGADSAYRLVTALNAAESRPPEEDHGGFSLASAALSAPPEPWPARPRGLLSAPSDAAEAVQAGAQSGSTATASTPGEHGGKGQEQGARSRRVCPGASHSTAILASAPGVGAGVQLTLEDAA